MAETASPAPNDRSEVGGVVVAYHPDAGFAGRLQEFARQVSALVVVDNSELAAAREPIAAACRLNGWVLIASGVNEGIAVALNKGVSNLMSRGFRWALLFDQDGTPAPKMGEEMIASCQRHSEVNRVAVIGPRFVEASTGKSHRVLGQHPRIKWWFRKIDVGDHDLPSVTMVITSGSLLRIEAWEQCGRFDEGMFIDYVDTDFCLKCMTQGWLIAVSAAGRMTHQLGSRERRRWLGFNIHPTNHSPLRHYYMSRNRIPVWKRYAGKFPHWALFDIAALILWTFRVVTVEDDKLAKLEAMTRGTWAGLRNRTGRAQWP